MIVRDDGRPDANGDRNRKRRLAVAGATGLAVVAGAGAILLTTRTDDPAPPDLGAVAPIVATPSATTAPSPAASSGMPSPASSADGEQMATADSVPDQKTKSAAPKASASTAKAATNDEVRKKIEAARSKAAADGHPVQRPLTASTGVAAESLDSYMEKSRKLDDGGVLRIFSAKGDLSNQREMLWAADSGEASGDARCTQKFRFAQNAEPAVRPSMLLCWRITSKRSVVVLAIAKKGSPSAPQTVAALDTEWTRIG